MDPKVPVVVSGAAILVVLWLAGVVGSLYIVYLIIMALKKYIGT